MNPDWIPSVNMGYKAKIKTLGCSSRFQNLNKGIALKTEITEVRLSLECCKCIIDVILVFFLCVYEII